MSSPVGIVIAVDGPVSSAGLAGGCESIVSSNERHGRSTAPCCALREYGSSADPECNMTLACEGSQFEAAWAPRPRGTCFSDICPESGDVGSLDGKPCALESDSSAITDADEAVCNMADGVCACTTGRDGASWHERRWSCVKPISVCPPNRPVLGSACTGTLWCDYGSCAFKRGSVMECVQGIWLTGGATCE